MVFIIIVLLRLLQVYSNILIIFALLSWFPKAYETKIGRLIIWLVKPVLKPFRNFRLSFAGIDFTIIAIILIIDVVSQFLISLIS